MQTTQYGTCMKKYMALNPLKTRHLALQTPNQQNERD